MKPKTKSFLYNLPVIGYLLSWAISVAKLPSTRRETTQQISKLQGELQEQKTNSVTSFESLTNAVMDLQKYEKSLDTRVADISHQLLMNKVRPNTATTTTQSPARFADNHDVDRFYIEFENKFRGREEEIIERLEEYLPYFTAIKKQSLKKPVLDIGCGRGEFLELMKNVNINAIGLDINSTMVRRSIDKGFNAVEADAMEYLAKKEAKSFSAITGFHIVEHIPFNDLLRLMAICYRAVTENGFVLFETPNPENLSVGAFSFYYDPSHLKPIPPQLLAFTLEYVGFKKIEILPLHPEIDTNGKSTVSKMDKQVIDKLFGPRDYAVIAYK